MVYFIYLPRVRAFIEFAFLAIAFLFLLQGLDHVQHYITASSSYCPFLFKSVVIDSNATLWNLEAGWKEDHCVSDISWVQNQWTNVKEYDRFLRRCCTPWKIDEKSDKEEDNLRLIDCQEEGSITFLGNETVEDLTHIYSFLTGQELHLIRHRFGLFFLFPERIHWKQTWQEIQETFNQWLKHYPTIHPYIQQIKRFRFVIDGAGRSVEIYWNNGTITNHLRW